ncbi:MAG: flagellar export protein FliJ, partial [Thermodesulfovibrionales bacterium]
RIEKIINLKGFTREQLELEARRRREELRIENERLEDLENLFNETINRFSEKQKTGHLDTKEISLFYDYISHMERRIKEQKKVVHKKRELLLEKEKEVMKAHREKRLLEILHDSLIKEEMKEALTREQKDMDLDFLMRRLRK